MIRYSLICSDGHSFESWFQSAAAFEKLSVSRLIACAVCGGSKVEKAVMAPAVASHEVAAPQSPGGLAHPATPIEAALAAMRRAIEANSEYVGLGFAAEARAIHDGDAPERSIYGEARADEARKLIEDGVQVAPLPFFPTRKVN